MGKLVVAVIESGVEMKADLILIQEAEKGKDSMKQHVAYRWIGDEGRRTRAALQKTSPIEVQNMTDIAGAGAETDVQVLEIRMEEGGGRGYG